MKLILVRHGETDLNRDGRILGLTDAPLNATGRSQASAVAAPLSAELPFKMYVSPLARAMETAHIVADALGITPTPLSGLQEADAGELDAEHVVDRLAFVKADPGQRENGHHMEQGVAGQRREGTDEDVVALPAQHLAGADGLQFAFFQGAGVLIGDHQAQAREQLRRFLTPGTGYQPHPARMFHD